MKILAISSALHEKSSSEKLVDFILQSNKDKNLFYEKIELKRFSASNIKVDLDLIEKQGLPKSIEALSGVISSSDAIIICTPEYNGSFPGRLKSVLDLVSMHNRDAFTVKPMLLISTSSGKYGGIKAIMHLQQPLFTLGAIVYPKLVAVQSTKEGFDETDMNYLRYILEEFKTFTKRNQKQCLEKCT